MINLSAKNRLILHSSLWVFGAALILTSLSGRVPLAMMVQPCFYFGVFLCVTPFILNRLQRYVDTNHAKRLFTGWVLTIVVFLMSCVAYLMIPFYHFICGHLDVGGKVQHFSGKVNKNQHPAVLATTHILPIVTVNGNAVIEVKSSPIASDVRLGTTFKHSFVLVNPLDKPVNIRFRMAMSPTKATHFVQEVSHLDNHTISFKPREKKSFTVVFHVDKKLPAGYRDVAVAYSLFEQAKHHSVLSGKQ